MVGTGVHFKVLSDGTTHQLALRFPCGTIVERIVTVPANEWIFAAMTYEPLSEDGSTFAKITLNVR